MPSATSFVHERATPRYRPFGPRVHSARARGARVVVLTSARNPKVIAAVRLKKRALRETERRFLVEGAQAVAEALAEDGRLLTLFV